MLTWLTLNEPFTVRSRLVSVPLVTTRPGRVPWPKVTLRLPMLAMLTLASRFPQRDRSSVAATSPPIRLALIIPAHNEEANVRATHAEIRRVLSATPHPVELVFVDDGSSDATPERIRELASADPLVRLIRGFPEQAKPLPAVEDPFRRGGLPGDRGPLRGPTA